MNTSVLIVVQSLSYYAHLVSLTRRLPVLAVRVVLNEYYLSVLPFPKMRLVGHHL